MFFDDYHFPCEKERHNRKQISVIGLSCLFFVLRMRTRIKISAHGILNADQPS
jgi:hypothetical protein